MKLMPTYTYLSNGEKIINSYRVALQKTQVEQAGFCAGQELIAEYKDNVIILKPCNKNVIKEETQQHQRLRGTRNKK